MISIDPNGPVEGLHFLLGDTQKLLFINNSSNLIEDVSAVITNLKRLLIVHSSVRFGVVIQSPISSQTPVILRPSSRKARVEIMAEIFPV